MVGRHVTSDQTQIPPTVSLEIVQIKPALRKAGALCVLMAITCAGCGTRESTSDRSRNTGTSTISFTGCTDSQTSFADEARGEAVALATAASAYLRANSTGRRFTTWFGTPTSARWTTVTAAFERAATALAGNLDITCNNPDCGSGTFTFSYPTQTDPHRLYACDAFWTAGKTGADSRGGSLIHEITHAKDIAGTTDFQFGMTAASDLAMSQPDVAVTNADNYEYFAENPTNIVDIVTSTTSTSTSSTSTSTTTTSPQTTVLNVATTDVPTTTSASSTTTNPTTTTIRPLPTTTLAANAPTQGKRRVVTIVCKKSNVKKKVTGANPRCPSGYKKI